ncbi:enoyl-CoA hydratase/isomerase family protein [Pseudenhygromyxa sp. WMMC2535]|uniref:enoyl-CoA hydratase/isomerase family protein n=1 Tax=Pseudenhygromyxa sp. WMMC2535 TaxID=2712867 RepID=UPI0015579FE3|nr:enoyl-CoA hydratase/isomerase family protein [Pseudenhygromyxa sp. WMMC2535]NVB40963.1 enoyl-CoA hydratase/isomerase family protein [Pseudenhygromyxa sp. WMMC2535]
MSEFGLIDIIETKDVFTIEIGGLDGDTHAGLARVFRKAHESDARVVVVTGKNKSFLAPEQYEFEWVEKLGIYEDMLKIFKEAEDIIRDAINCEKTTIAKVYAPGAHSLGASIALSCDFVYASEDSTFSDPHLSGFGVPPGDGGALLWPARIGLSRAREFLMTDRSCTAKEAVDIGLINKAVPADELDGAVDELVAKLLSYDPLGLKMTKKWLNQYLQQNMNVVGMGTLFAEGMVLASGDFAKKTEAYGKQLEAEGKRKG